MEQRSRLYDKMARVLDEKGPTFLKHGETSQSLSFSDIFTLENGSVAPVLKQTPPVGPNVLNLNPEYSVPISEAVKQIFSPYLDEAEATAVEAVAKELCPLKNFLDRVVLTSTGVLLGCWQYDAAILHTSFARILGHRKASPVGRDSLNHQATSPMDAFN